MCPPSGVAAKRGGRLSLFHPTHRLNQIADPSLSAEFSELPIKRFEQRIAASNTDRVLTPYLTIGGLLLTAIGIAGGMWLAHQPVDLPVPGSRTGPWPFLGNVLANSSHVYVLGPHKLYVAVTGKMLSSSGAQKGKGTGYFTVKESHCRLRRSEVRQFKRRCRGSASVRANRRWCAGT
jgi:hypothetical protein